MASNRYNVVGNDGKHFLLSQSSIKIVKALIKNADGLSYDNLQKKTKVERQSLYVFVSRLRKAKLASIGQKKTRKGELETVVILKPEITLTNTVYVG